MRVAVMLAKSKIQGGKRLAVAQRHVNHSVQVNGFRIRRDDGDADARIDETDDGREFLDFSSYLRPESGARAQPKNLPIKTDAGLARIHDEGLVAQIADLYRTLLCERMIIGDRCHQRRPVPFFDLNPRRDGRFRSAKDACIKSSIMQSVQLIERRHFVKGQQNMWKSNLELLDRPGQRRCEHRGRSVAKMQRTHLAERGTPHLRLGGFH
jgi:hypothetical protein